MAASASPPAKAPRRRPLWLRTLGWFFLTLFILVGGGLGGGYVYFRHSLPTISGSAQVRGLAAPLEIVRTSDGIPHIYAASEADAMFGLGYAHAQDRLWQMEFQRRVGRGALAEVLGEKALNTDRFLRTLGVYRAAEQAYATLDPEAKAWLDAYTGGINAFLAEHSGWELPPEFTLIGVVPEPWRGADVLAWSKMMAWDLGGNWSSELLRLDLIGQIGPERTAELLPDYPGGGVLILPDLAGAAPPAHWLSGADQIQRDLGLGGGVSAGTGSNNWVISGARSATGRPLLADDPHLSFKAPSIWYLAEIQGGALHATGATIPGLPGIIIGHNEHIAWGVTNLGPDVQDLYRERLDPSGTRAEYQGAFEPLAVITETITVKDKGLLDLQIRSSRHGPLISDALNANNRTAAENDQTPEREALAFRWSALDPVDGTMQAYFKLSLAKNWDEFTSALRTYSAPAQNFVYADVAGNIGYYAPGNIPIRAAGEGLVPAEGWSGASDWTGYIPFDDLPHSYNPPAGFIASANNRPLPAGYPYFLGREWAAPYRAQRIDALITAKDKLALDDMRAIQGDQHSLYAEQIVPLLLKETVPASDRQRQALDLLRSWDYNVAGGSAAAAIFEAWVYYLPAPILGDELGPRLMSVYGARRNAIVQVLPAILAAPASPWCDTVTTSAVTEQCGAHMAEALEVALRDLAARFGNDDLAAWRWDQIHLAFFPHQPLDTIPALQRFVSRGIGNGGDGTTVNVASISSSEPFDQVHGPMFRQIIDVGDWGNSRFIDALGQSGHPLSEHYDDFLERWQRVEYLPMRFDRAATDAAAAGTLRLEPLP